MKKFCFALLVLVIVGGLLLAFSHVASAQSGNAGTVENKPKAYHICQAFNRYGSEDLVIYGDSAMMKPLAEDALVPDGANVGTYGEPPFESFVRVNYNGWVGYIYNPGICQEAKVVVYESISNDVYLVGTHIDEYLEGESWFAVRALDNEGFPTIAWVGDYNVSAISENGVIVADSGEQGALIWEDNRFYAFEAAEFAYFVSLYGTFPVDTFELDLFYAETVAIKEGTETEFEFDSMNINQGVIVSWVVPSWNTLMLEVIRFEGEPPEASVQVCPDNVPEYVCSGFPTLSEAIEMQ